MSQTLRSDLQAGCNQRAKKSWSRAFYLLSSTFSAVESMNSPLVSCPS